MSLVPRTRDQRVFLLAQFINTYGTGLILTAAMLYGIKVVHLTPARTGLAISIAGLVGLFSSMPIGRLADLRGPREVFALSLLLLATTNAAYVFLAHDFVSLLLIAIVDTAAMNASNAVAVALTRRVGGEDAITLRAQMSAVLNVGTALGVATCGIALQLNTVSAYRALFLGNALSYLAGAVIVGLLPRFEPLPGAHEESPLAALKDKAFVGYTLLSGGMTLQYLIPMMLMPVWVVFHTNAPRWSVSAFMIINTLIAFLFQVRVGKKVQTIRQGGAAFRRAGVIFLFSCSAMGLASGLPGWAALLLLAAAVLLLTYGELWQSSGMFALDFGSRPRTRRASTRAWPARPTSARWRWLPSSCSAWCWPAAGSVLSCSARGSPSSAWSARPWPGGVSGPAPPRWPRPEIQANLARPRWLPSDRDLTAGIQLYRRFMAGDSLRFAGLGFCCLFRDCGGFRRAPGGCGPSARGRRRPGGGPAAGSGWFTRVICRGDHGLTVSADGEGLVGQAGGTLLRETADKPGLTAALAGAPEKEGRFPGVDRGVAMVSAAMMIALGGRSMSGIAVLGHLSLVRGEPVTWQALRRTLDLADPGTLGRSRRPGQGSARTCAVGAGASPGTPGPAAHPTRTGSGHENQK